MAQAAALWKTMGTKERKPFGTLATRERRDRAEAMRVWKEANPDQAKSVYQKKTKEPKKASSAYIKKSAYSLFLELFQREKASQFDSEKALVKACAAQWGLMDGQQREQYKREAKHRAQQLKRFREIDEEAAAGDIELYDTQMRERLASGEMLDPPRYWKRQKTEEENENEVKKETKDELKETKDELFDELDWEHEGESLFRLEESSALDFGTMMDNVASKSKTDLGLCSVDWSASDELFG